MVGLNNVTVITMDNITKIANSTDFSEFAININNVVYEGYLFFILLLVLNVIIYFALQDKENQPITNLMYSTTAITFISVFIRAIYVVQNGVQVGLLTDQYLYIFPLTAILLATVLWMTTSK